jgi:hypothetical protein
MRHIETLINPETKEIRVAFRLKSFIIVVKTFDPDAKGLTSIKLFDRPECYQRTKSFWRTRSILNSDKIVQDARNIIHRYTGKMLCEVFYGI